MFLSLLIFLPLVFACILGSFSKKKWIPHFALGFSFIEFILSLYLFFAFDPQVSSLQLVEQYSWIPSIGISYFLGLDGLSFWLILLTTFLTFITVLSSQKSIKNNEKGFYASLFILETSVLGTFLSIDAVLFYIFFEFSLIPMYFIIGLWGGPRRIYASIKFFIFTMAGSVLMLIALVTLIFMTKSLPEGAISASLLDFYRLDLPFIAGDFFSLSSLLFFAFAIAFAVKIPLFPLHTWLPEAHVEAPTSGSILLAGVMLKMGAYGFLRFVFPLFPQATEYWSWIFLLFSAFGIIYGALVAMAQSDIKKLVAYSSISHMGYVMLGLFAFNIEGFSGGLFQMLSHGISTGALFLLVGMIYERTHSREISFYGGLATKAPSFTIFFLIVSFSSIAVPLTNGFIGEFLILLGVFNSPHKPYAFVAIFGVILGASYILWMIHKVFFGPESPEIKKRSQKSLDINLREKITLIPLIVLIFWMGILPNHFLKWTGASLNHLIKNRFNYKLEIAKLNPKLDSSKLDSKLNLKSNLNSDLKSNLKLSSKSNLKQNSKRSSKTNQFNRVLNQVKINKKRTLLREKSEKPKKQNKRDSLVQL